jgi:hypothetical protein
MPRLRYLKARPGLPRARVVQQFGQVIAFLLRDLGGGGELVALAGGAIADGKQGFVLIHREAFVGEQALGAVHGQAELLDQRGGADAGGPDDRVPKGMVEPSASRTVPWAGLP